MIILLCSFMLCDGVFFFFKQKTAYEMRISDWSSDVCSSDLWSFSCLFRGRTRYPRPGGDADRPTKTSPRPAPEPVIPTRSVFLLELLGQFLDVLGWPARNIHAEPQAHAGENFLDLVERLAAEVGRAQHLGLGLLNQIADVDDVVVLQAIGRTDGKFQLVHLLEEIAVDLAG